MTRTRRALVRALALTFALLAAPALAQPEAQPAAFRLPWGDMAPALDAGVVRVAAVGVPDERIGRFDPRRDSARRSGRGRAVAALHVWADEALAALRAGPREAVATHAAIDRHARVEAVRPRVDGGAVVVVVVPLEALREACPASGAPWGAR